jgi:tetratricopeptide (TPR) repeat protein
MHIYGVLIDANVEMGVYETVVSMSDKLHAIKPSQESYSRASYLRDIYGDYQGAIDAMKIGVEAGLPGSEPQCWAKKVLGNLYERTGKWNEAERQYKEILLDEASGHTVALEMCILYTKMGQYAPDLAYGMKEYALRPLNFDVNNALAWLSFQTSDIKKAREHIKIAMRTGSKDPELLKRSALIEKGSK